ncbi:MAG: GNAT family N-acetyltransferase [Ferrovibrio sp.]|uniref:GNAT family N-acetyltransferase n=1 Tax=Ferrovibrio sp. TaxID=1917215 RepID=UPI002603AFFF|nr:GNAT family N-acetyltransferase [Ferrovibrio sp.]MCW0233875.1 GNAT family N-acetyltransferase [Ferrovibrio sp.]
MPSAVAAAGARHYSGTMICTIHDLRDRPDLLDAVATAIWATFWQHKGSALSDLQAGFRKHLVPGDLPFTLAAERDGVFCGTASLIACDEPERSDLAPWLAALWVAPDRRKAGLGAALVAEIERRAAALGIARLYLSARPAVQGFYEKRGWQVIDTEIGPAQLSILERVVNP